MADRDDDFTTKHLNRNIVVQLLHGMFGQTGFRLTNAPTFLPIFLFAVSGSEFAVGLARSLQAAGQVLTPVAGATLISHRPKILGITLVAGALMRVQILGIALAGFLLGTHPAAIWVIIAMLTLMGLFQGLQGVMLNTLRAKVIPIERRGMVSGWRNMLAGATTAGVSYFAGDYFIETNLGGNGYASLFLLAFVITMIGLVALAFSAEPRATDTRPRQTMRQGFANAPAYLRGNTPYLNFFIATTLGSVGRMALPFYVLYASTQMTMTGALLGVLTTLWMLTGTATNLVWGSMADRHGYRVVLLATLALWFLSHAYLLQADGPASFMIFFVLIGTASGGYNQARQNMALELGTEQDIPIRVAITNTAVNAMGMVGPAVGGLIAWLTGYVAVFWTCLVLQFVALVMLYALVPEPRRRTGTDNPATD